MLTVGGTQCSRLKAQWWTFPQFKALWKITKKSGRGRRPKGADEEHNRIVREEYAAKPYVAGYGQVRSRFEKTAERANENPNLENKVSWKSVQDRYVKF